jgi:hypothetical protein
MKSVYFSAIRKFNVPYDKLSPEQQEYLEEGLNKRGDDNGEL